MRLLSLTLLATAFAAPAASSAATNAGRLAPSAAQPFATAEVARFDNPWALAFLPDGRMIVTEKPGGIYLVSQRGSKAQVTGVPKVAYSGQGGLLDVAISPGFARDHLIYLTYAEPGAGGSGLALARARLVGNGAGAMLQGLQVIWRQLPRGDGGQYGGYIAFSPDGRYLFLASGERMRKTPAQDPDQALGKVLRLTLDGKAAPGNPMFAKGGVRAQTWTSGHRNQYGLSFDRAGRLWEMEMGPKGGDELNLLKPGRNYGWPAVSYGINYDGTPIPRHDTRPEFEKPLVYWTPVIAPAGFSFYYGNLFPAWRGSAFAGGLAGECLVRIAFDGKGGARQADRWNLGFRVRNVVAGPDGALWLLEDGDNARLLRLTPKG